MSREIKRVAVIGAGTMGPGTAFDYAKTGLPVAIWTRSEKTLSQAKERIGQILDVRVNNGTYTRQQADAIAANFTYTNDLTEAVKGADLILEAVAEKLDIKKDVFEKLDALLPEDVIIASDTSALDIFSVMPERRLPYTVILHGFMPPEVVPLIEIVKGEKTSAETMETAKEIVEKMDKVGVVMEKYTRGFIVNRLQGAILREAYKLVTEGFATPEQIDTAVKSSIMPRASIMGLFQTKDFNGLDIGYNPENPNTPQFMKDLVENGNLGVKTGKGFYDYTGRSMEQVFAERDNAMLKAFANNKEFQTKPL